MALSSILDQVAFIGLQPAALETIADEIDIVETFNARVSRPRWNQAAVDWAKLHGVPMSAARMRIP